jgi:hypothetical protein
VTSCKPHNVTARTLSAALPSAGAFRSGPLGHSLRSPYRAMRGFGGTTIFKDPPTQSDQVNFPYGKYSAQTLQLQNTLNKILIQKRFCPLVADGKLGPATCGAALDADILTDPDAIAAGVYAPTTCEDVKWPSLASDGCGTGPVPPPQALTPPKPQSSLATLPPSVGRLMPFLLAGGFIAAFAVYSIKKRLGR